MLGKVLRDMRFEDYIDTANKAQSKGELFNIYSKAIAEHGLDRVLFCLVTDHSDIGETSGIGLMHNYPQHWMNYYFENRFDQIDPVMIYGLDKYHSYSWVDVKKRMDLEAAQSLCLDLGQESGLHHGVCTPLRGPKASIAGLSLASSEKKDSFDGKIDLINAYSNHFYIAFRRLAEKEHGVNNTPNITLTPIEKEILTWKAKGKSDHDVADILNCSAHAIDYHTRKIFKKLQSNSMTECVVKAITFGLIVP